MIIISIVKVNRHILCRQLFGPFEEALSPELAVSANVSEGDRFVVNRWRKKESAGSSKIALSIDQHQYVDVSLVMAPFLRYTQSV